ncbi:MFS transporter, partial [Thioclava sp. BHET1]
MRALCKTAGDRVPRFYMTTLSTDPIPTLPPAAPAVPARALPVLAGASLGHLFNDLMQSLLVASYPVIRGDFDLSFAQIGLLTLGYQITASILQPLFGWMLDRRAQPWSLPLGMSFTLCGLLVLAFAPSYPLLLLGALLLGTGSAVFHPGAARIARMASGGGFGFAQAVFQVGGNTGTALGPLAVAFVVLPEGRGALADFAPLALVAIGLLAFLGWWSRGRSLPRRAPRAAGGEASAAVPQRMRRTLAILFLLIFAKYFYLASFTSYFTFYLAARFGVTGQGAQLALFAFLAAEVVGVMLGGPLCDRLGTRRVIQLSFWGTLPFALILPHVGLALTLPLAMLAGGIIASAFSAIVVHAQEMMP